MKTIALTLFTAALGFAQGQLVPPAAPPPSQKSAPKPTAPAPKPGPQNAKNKKPAPSPKLSAAQVAKAQSQTQTIPAGAKLVEPNLYRFTDSSGKTWNYRQTPFGISRWEETAASAPQPAAASEPVAVTDLGDSYRFDRKTPFGGSSWVRKKSELTDEEKALASGQHVSNAPTVDGKPAGNQ